MTFLWTEKTQVTQPQKNEDSLSFRQILAKKKEKLIAKEDSSVLCLWLGPTLVSQSLQDESDSNLLFSENSSLNQTVLMDTFTLSEPKKAWKVPEDKQRRQYL